MCQPSVYLTLATHYCSWWLMKLSSAFPPSYAYRRWVSVNEARCVCVCVYVCTTMYRTTAGSQIAVDPGTFIRYDLLWLHLPNMKHKSKVHFQTVGEKRCKQNVRKRNFAEVWYSFQFILSFLNVVTLKRFVHVQYVFCPTSSWYRMSDWGGVWMGLWVIRVEEWQFVSRQCIS